jgi:hypothetical protein
MVSHWAEKRDAVCQRFRGHPNWGWETGLKGVEMARSVTPRPSKSASLYYEIHSPRIWPAKGGGNRPKGGGLPRR